MKNVKRKIYTHVKHRINKSFCSPCVVGELLLIPKISIGDLFIDGDTIYACTYTMNSIRGMVGFKTDNPVQKAIEEYVSYKQR